MILTREKLNEVSAELLKRAERAQRKKLDDEEYLKSISAWEYIKSLKRADDFKKYADDIMNAIQDGNVGSPDAKPVELENTEQPATENVIAVSVLARKKEIKQYRIEHKGTLPERQNTIVPDFDNINERAVGIYCVIYLSSLDNDVHGIWVEGHSINNAIQIAKNSIWDMKEIQDVEFKGKEKVDNDSTFETQAVVSSKSNIDVADIQKAGSSVASTLTHGQFDNMRELVADCHDDQTTEECAKGYTYNIVDVNGNEWSGQKSSYREVLDSGKFSNTNDYDVTLITKVVPGGTDETAKIRFNDDAFRLALKNGIVHFAFIKKSTNKERQAFGTINDKILEDCGVVPSDKQQYTRNKSPEIIVYYDLTAHAWRSLIRSNMTIIYDESY